MTPEERDVRLTAYALEDPGLTPEDRKEVEAALKIDPAARKTFLETRELARLLASGLAAEQSAAAAEPPVTIPSEVAARPKKSGRWVLNAVAVSVLLAVFGGLFVTLSKSGRPDLTFFYVGSNVAPAPAAGKRAMTLDSNLSASIDLPATNEVGAQVAAGTRMGGGGDAGREESTKELRDGLTDGRKSLPTDPASGPAGITNDTPAKSASPAPAPTYPPGYGGSRGGMIAGRGGPGGTGPGEGKGDLGSADPKPAAPKESFDRSITTSEGTRQYRYEKQDNGEWKLHGVVKEDGSVVPIQGNTLPSPNDRYPALVENRFIAVEGQAALSTFGMDVDTASYAIVRKYLTMGQLPPANAVRLEELVNYFPYADKAPDGDDPFAVTVELAECPWQPKHRLARIGLKARPVATDKRPPSNLVFLIDVSGSMAPENRLPLVKASLKLLVNQLGENDRVAMVVYAGTTGLVLDSTPATRKDLILAALDRLEAGGSTNGSGGVQQAYAVAAANFIKGGTNRVILCTDGDWNVGTTSTEALVQMIEEKRGTGVFLSVFGFGMGNLRDEMMVKLAGKGNGNYGYIDTLKEAHKSLVEQLGGTLVTVAKDVKIQVEFNPAVVGAYRLLGYEKRALAAKDFADDKKDAGEMGAGHVVTALYELVPAGAAAPSNPDEGLRYQQPDPAPKAVAKGGKAGESFVVKMRHKKPDGDTSTLREQPVTDTAKGYADASEDFRFSAAVASFAMLLRESPFKGNATFAAVQELADAARKSDPGGYRAEFLELVRQAKALSGKP